MVSDAVYKDSSYTGTGTGRNGAEIDAASGATMTSDGFREAVAQALSKAS